MLILALESSCDETAASVSRDGREILSNVVYSQIDMHALYGGVVPEIASRKHAEKITAVAAEAIREAGIQWSDLDAVAATCAPGLIGALQEFTRFQVMTPDGGPAYQGMTVVFYLYKQLFNASGGSDLGVASAMGWIIAVLITVVTILNFRMQRKWVNYD